MNSLRIIVITQGVSRILPTILKINHEIVGVVESAPRGYHKNIKLNAIKDAVMHCMALLFGVPSLKRWCQKLMLPYFKMYVGRDQRLNDFVENLSPDLIVIYSMSQLLKKNILQIPKYGAINLHPSLLPSYRGPNPDFWQYYDFVLERGVTVHMVDEGEDTGDILLQEKYKMPIGMKSSELNAILIGDVGGRLLAESINLISSNKIKRVPQLADSITGRARNLKPGEHGSLINWTEWEVVRIWHLLRGTESWFNALPRPAGVYWGQRWIVNNYIEIKKETNDIPGCIYSDVDGRYVACKNGKIYVSIKFSSFWLCVALFNKLKGLML